VIEYIWFNIPPDTQQDTFYSVKALKGKIT